MSVGARPRKRVVDYIIMATNSIRELLLLYIVMIVLAAWGFAYFEQKPFGDSLWWAIVTTTTTGYGDMFPVTVPGRLIASFVMLAAILFVLPLLIGYIATTLIQNRDAYTHEEQERMMAELAAVRAELAQLSARLGSQS
ncbi:potassium channel family protein [Phenylobacterium sp.]|uniref:potassium channel family protein n=1 Tax=Phenylobacterium sp. TaxID=1871053 RepID=UPI002ED89BDD